MHPGRNPHWGRRFTGRLPAPGVPPGERWYGRCDEAAWRPAPARSSAPRLGVPRPGRPGGAEKESRAMSPRSDPRTSQSILVVEDDPDVSAAICEVLEEEGFGVTLAKTGLDALESLA